MQTDIEIAQGKELKPITEIASLIRIPKEELVLYGNYKAKVPYSFLDTLQTEPDGKLILVTAMTPTKAGEGKTTTAIGLGEALFKLKERSIICIREPSLGPCFGIKGGAAGGGLAQVLPMEDINLHFTGDIHAVTYAHDLLSAMIDNSLYQGNLLKIDPNEITWPRVLDLNDRALRKITLQYGKNKDKDNLRGSRFDISVASEVMAILCLSLSITDLKKRLSKIIIGSNKSGKPIYASDLKAVGAMALLLKDALSPNLVQTYEGSPAFVHGGPFANIAHGCSSLVATKMALKMADYVVTEAGFAADLGAEKFFDIKCQLGGLKPSAVVIVASIRALKLHGNGDIKPGLENLGKHIENMQKFGVTPIVALNRFSDDLDSEYKLIAEYCQQFNCITSLSEVWEKGSSGGIDLAEKVMEICKKENTFHPLYEIDQSPEEIVNIICKEIYGADGVEFSDKAKADLKRFKDWGIANLPVCIAKTQSSLSDNPKLLGRPKGFKINISEVRLANGAGFFIPIAGSIQTMPGLPKVPAAENIDIDESGKITGLF